MLESSSNIYFVTSSILQKMLAVGWDVVGKVVEERVVAELEADKEGVVAELEAGKEGGVANEGKSRSLLTATDYALRVLSM